MKKLFMCTLLEGTVLIILFQLFGFKAGFSEGSLFWVGQYVPIPQPSYIKKN